MPRKPISFVGFAIAIVLALFFSVFRETRAMHHESMPALDDAFTEWNGYTYWQQTDTRFTLEGQVASVSPNGRAFCSGPFAGGPGLALVLEVGTARRRLGISLSAFGVEDTEQALHGLRVGSRVRLSGTEGTVRILRDEQEQLRVEPVGGWWSLGRQHVVVVRTVEPL